MERFILALDQGTTSSRAIVFRHDGSAVASAQAEIKQILPAPGIVEHDPDEIWSSQLDVARRALAAANISAAQIAAIGVTNQRETTILWERATGRPVGNAIVWQSRISAPICERLRAQGCEETFRAKTGLVLDPYFSGTKIRHLFEKHSGLRERAGRGEVLFGTVDSWLVWKLTGGRCHATDASNASRTLLFNIQTLDWDDELLSVLDVPRAMLPAVRDSCGHFDQTAPEWFGQPIPIAGVIGDQQAATFGQACFSPGEVKNTYGTGCFLLMNVGDTPVRSKHNLLSTVGWSINGKTVYCLEGAVFIGGAVVQWLRDGLKVLRQSSEIEALAASVPDSGGVVFVPAFVGLGAPYWDPFARGAIFGLSRNTTVGHLARAALESMAHQTADLLDAMHKDADRPIRSLKADGGASVNNGLLQFQSDLLGVPVRRPIVSETTALGAAYLAGLGVGFWSDLGDVAKNWRLDREFTPAFDDSRRHHARERWRRAVRRALDWEDRPVDSAGG